MCSRSGAAKRRFRYHNIEFSIQNFHQCAFHTSIPAEIKTKSQFSDFFFFFLKQVFLFLNFMHFASATETPAYLEDVSHFYLKMLNNFISYFRIGCGKRWDDMSVDGTIPSSYRCWCY